MKALEVEKLTKRYGSVIGAEDVTFSVNSGEVFGYLGPNGSGKTTTIRCIMGLLRASSGSCAILGDRVETRMGTRHRDIGYLPGDLRLWGGLRAGKALEVLGRLGGRDSSAGRRRELAERLELDLNRRIGDLSKGNRQKVGVVNAFQNDPKLLILDEPTIGLDPLVRQTVLALIREAARDGAAVLLSSHDLSEVSAVCERAAILRGGRLVELASVSSIVEQGRQYLRIWFSETTVPPVDVLEGLSSVSITERDGRMLCISYTGAVGELLSCLSRYSVERMAPHEASLEQAFIQYYSGDARGEAAR